MKKFTKTLRTLTAADLMSPDPVSIAADATIREAVAFLTDKGFSGAPVIDSAGWPIGVVSRADIIVHDREKVEYVPAVPDYYHDTDSPTTRAGEVLGEGFQVEKVDRTRVRDIMTPAVFSVTPETPAEEVMEQMAGLKVHRLFVIGDEGVLVGVISALDIVRHLATKKSKQLVR